MVGQVEEWLGDKERGMNSWEMGEHMDKKRPDGLGRWVDGRWREDMWVLEE